MQKILKTRLQIKKDSTNGWAAADPILLSGELGYDNERKLLKIGNGSDCWSELSDFTVDSKVLYNNTNNQIEYLIPLCIENTNDVYQKRSLNFFTEYRLKRLTFKDGLLKSPKIQAGIEPMELKSNSNLNYIINPGIYVCPYEDYIKTMSNVPTKRCFGLKVEKTTMGTNGGLFQELRNYSHPYEVYQRCSYNAAWSDWELIFDVYHGASKARYAHSEYIEYTSKDVYREIPCMYISGDNKTSLMYGDNKLQYNPTTDTLKCNYSEFKNIKVEKGITVGDGSKSKIMLANGTLYQPNTLISKVKTDTNPIIHELSTDIIIFDNKPIHNSEFFTPLTANVNINKNSIIDLPFGYEREYADNTIIFMSISNTQLKMTIRFPCFTHVDLPIRKEVAWHFSNYIPKQENNVVLDTIDSHYYQHLTALLKSASFYMNKNEPLIFKWYRSGNDYYLSLISN